MTVFVATLEYKYGKEVRVFSTAKRAEDWRQEIAHEYWSKEIGEEPDDCKDAADEYFEYMESSGEFFSVEECEVED